MTALQDHEAGDRLLGGHVEFDPLTREGRLDLPDRVVVVRGMEADAAVIAVGAEARGWRCARVLTQSGASDQPHDRRRRQDLERNPMAHQARVFRSGPVFRSDP